MEEIEVGEYVRTRKGYIAKVKQIICKGYPIKELEGHIICDDEDRTILNPNEVNHSKNKIDLIEEGDYVNGYRVDEVRISSFNSMLFCNDYHIEIQEYQIKSIVTKEQFKSVEYGVD